MIQINIITLPTPTYQENSLLYGQNIPSKIQDVYAFSTDNYQRFRISQLLYLQGQQYY